MGKLRLQKKLNKYLLKKLIKKYKRIIESDKRVEVKPTMSKKEVKKNKKELEVKQKIIKEVISDINSKKELQSKALKNYKQDITKSAKKIKVLGQWIDSYNKFLMEMNLDLYSKP